MDNRSFVNNKQYRPASNYIRMKMTKGSKPRHIDVFSFRTNMTKNIDDDIKTYLKHPLLMSPMPSKSIDHMLKMCQKADNMVELSYMRRSKFNKTSYKDARRSKMES